MSASPVQEAQLSRDILRMIFDASTQGQNAIHARVCKAWANDALSCVWEDVEVLHIFSLLSPMLLRSDGTYVFGRRVTLDDWDRFNSQYAWRVRKLKMRSRIYSSAWMQLAYQRPRMAILPNLKEVFVFQTPIESNTSLFFCHPALSKLSILQWNLAGYNSVDLSFIPSKAPNLTTLELGTCEDRYTPRDGLNPIFDMPPTVQSHLRAALQNLPLLTSLTISAACLWFTGIMDAVPSSRLKYFQIYSLTRGFNQDLENPCKAFIDDLCSRFAHAQLETLILESDDVPCILSFTEFKSILSLSSLRHLALRACHPTLDNHQFISIFQALPLLTTLFLQQGIFNTHPEPEVTISSLIAIIPFCRNLEELHVELDATSVSLRNIADVSDVFPKLLLLNVGRSAITSPVTVGTLLAMILPESCNLVHSGVLQGDGAMGGHHQRALMGWMMVQDLLPSFMLVRRAERQKHTRSHRVAPK